MRPFGISRLRLLRAKARRNKATEPREPSQQLLSKDEPIQKLRRPRNWGRYHRRSIGFKPAGPWPLGHSHRPQESRRRDIFWERGYHTPGNNWTLRFSKEYQ